MTTRRYSSISQETTLTSPLSSSASFMIVNSASSLLSTIAPAVGETFTVVIDPDTSLEEIVDVVYPSTGSNNTVSIVRNVESGSIGVAHAVGAKVRHMGVGRDFREANTHINGTLAEHTATTSAQLASVISDETGSGSLVFATSPTLVTPTLGVATATSINGTTIPSSATLVKTSDTGTVTNTMLANDTITNAKINTAAAIDWTKIAPSSTVSATELGYLDGVTSAIQTQINAKLATTTAASTYAPLAGPALTGVPTAPTAAANTNTTQIATTAYVQTELTDLIGGAPGALDTLNELATALANDASYSTTITTALATKLPLAGGTMTGAIAMGTNKITGLGTPTAGTDASTKAYVDAILSPPSGNLSGVITSVGTATSIASQTGTGSKFVVDNTPTLITPVLGVATATSINGTTIPSSKTLVVTTDTLAVHAATTSAQLAGIISDETGSGALVFGTAPTVSLPVIDNIKKGFTTTVSSGTALVLTAASNYQQFITGTTAQTITLPVATTMTLGLGYQITNNSTATITVNSSGGNLVISIPAGFSASVVSILLTGTTAASWSAAFCDFDAVTGTGSVVAANTPTLVTPVIGAATGTSLALSGDLTSTNAGAFTSLKDFQTLTLMGAL